MWPQKQWAKKPFLLFKYINYILQIYPTTKHVTIVASPLDALMEDHVTSLGDKGIPVIRLRGQHRMTDIQIKGKCFTNTFFNKHKQTQCLKSFIGGV